MYNKFKYTNDRFGFAGPFLLGGLTGIVGTSVFNRPRPVYYSYPNYPMYPYY